MPKRYHTPRTEPLGVALEAMERRQRQIIEGLRDSFMSLDAEWRVTDCNARAEAILGKSRAELVGHEIWELVGVPPDSPLGEVARRVKHTGEPEEGEFTLRTNGGERLLSMRAFPLDQGVAVMAADITELRRTERRRAESEARFRDLANGVPAPTWMTGPKGAIEYVNPAMLDTLGIRAEESLARDWERQVHPDDLAPIRRAQRKAQARHTRIAFIARVRREHDAWRTLQVTGVPRFDAQGAFSGHVGFATDITDFIAAHKRQRMLINELNHRVKNTLATVQSIVRQTLKNSAAPRDTLDLLNDRLLALAAAHDIMAHENWEGAELTAMARVAVRPFDPDARLIAIAGPDVRLQPSAALALFLAINELATNAVRHGALSAPEGRVALNWTRSDSGVDVEWRESGGPAVAHPTRKGFGSRLLGTGLSAELGSPAQLLYAPEGLVCRIDVPPRALMT